MTVVAVFVGTPRTVEAGGSRVYTGGAKEAVPAAFLTVDGFTGDGQADLRHHGGRDRAACVYPAEHYRWWAAQGTPLALGAFSENLVIEQALEGEIFIGDVVRIGKAVAQVSLPRDPCRTIDRLTGIPGLHGRMRESGRCGFHLRTLQPGEVRAGDMAELVQRASHGITVSAVLDLYHGRSLDRELFRRLDALPEFAEQGKRDIARRLAPG